MPRSLIATTTVLATLAAPALAAPLDTLTGDTPLVIAHRGASGYLPEHTLPAYELGAQMGADYVEPDIGLTSDSVAIAMHDLTLDRTTDVEEVLGSRNGGYDVSDYTYDEIRQLTVQPQDSDSYGYPGFEPSVGEDFSVPTLQEVITFVNGFNTENGTDVGIYPELKTDLPELRETVVSQLIEGGFTSAEDKVFLQSFYASTLQEAVDLQDDRGTTIPQVMLGGVHEDGVLDFNSGIVYGFDEVAQFASGIGTGLGGITEGFLDQAHDAGLMVHGYTVNDATFATQAPYVTALSEAGLDGFFTNFPNVTGAVLNEAVAPVPLPGSAGMVLVGFAAMGALRLRRGS